MLSLLVLSLGDLDRRQAEIDENLIRNELTALERGEHHVERKAEEIAMAEALSHEVRDILRDSPVADSKEELSGWRSWSLRSRPARRSLSPQATRRASPSGGCNSATRAAERSRS